MRKFPCHSETIKMQFFNDDIFALRAFSMQYKIHFDGNATFCKEKLTNNLSNYFLKNPKI